MSDEARTAARCIVCGSTGGAVEARTRKPARVDVSKYGVPGVACCACYVAIVCRVMAGLCPITNRRPSEATDGQ